jgi:hypothetical protein
MYGKSVRRSPTLARLARSERLGQKVAMSGRDYPTIPDVRDGLTHRERVVLHVLSETQKERGDRNVPTAMLWGRVCEYFYISPEELSAMLARLGARR